jgi:hypothetical protein
MAKNIIILGCGRSGTSLVAGAITSGQSYNIGGAGNLADKFNEKGYFETPLVNGLNDDILWSCPKVDVIRTKVNSPQGWLATLETDTVITESKKLNECFLFDKDSRRNPRHKNIDPAYVNASVQERILKLISVQPFLFKDPRFSYTLPVWLPYLQNCKFICVFRHPSEFLQSISHIIKNAEYLQATVANKDFLEKLWFNTYTYILHHYSNLDMFFVNCGNLANGIGVQTLSDFVGHRIDKNFADKKLMHFSPEDCANNKLIELYNSLNEKVLV